MKMKMKTKNIATIVRWNSLTYGSAIKIKKNYLKLFLAIVCVCTPFTNWLFPIVVNFIKKDYYVRF